MSDKTGTLTRNTMEFFKCSVGGVKYGSGVTDIERTLAAREGKPLPPAEPGVGSGKPPEKGFNFVDDRLLGPPGPNGEAGPLAWPGRPDADTIRRFLLLLAVCHTVIPEARAGASRGGAAGSRLTS